MFNMIKDKNLKKTILENGWSILKQRGKNALRLRDLAKLSNCAIGTVYNLFQNLDEITLQLNLRCLEILYSSLNEVLEKELNAQADLYSLMQKLGRAYVQFGLNHPWMWKSLFENLAISPIPRWYSEKVQAGIQFIEEKIQIAYGIEPNRASCIVSFFWAAMHGITAIMLTKKMDVVSEKIDEEYLTSYIDHCTRGIIS